MVGERTKENQTPTHLRILRKIIIQNSINRIKHVNQEPLHVLCLHMIRHRRKVTDGGSEGYRPNILLPKQTRMGK
jgi:hypothetical protein